MVELCDSKVRWRQQSRMVRHPACLEPGEALLPPVTPDMVPELPRPCWGVPGSLVTASPSKVLSTFSFCLT